MIDQLTIQTIGVLVAASSVVLYIINLFLSGKKEEKNRKIVQSNDVLQMLFSKEHTQILAELLNCSWTDFKDFSQKYDSSVNPDNYAKRATLMGSYEHIGYLLKNGLIDREVVYINGGMPVIHIWAKYKPIIEELRRVAYGRDWGNYFEYLANEMWKMKRVRDPLMLRDDTVGLDIANVFEG